MANADKTIGCIPNIVQMAMKPTSCVLMHYMLHASPSSPIYSTRRSPSTAREGRTAGINACSCCALSIARTPDPYLGANARRVQGVYSVGVEVDLPNGTTLEATPVDGNPVNGNPVNGTPLAATPVVDESAPSVASTG